MKRRRLVIWAAVSGMAALLPKVAFAHPIGRAGYCTRLAIANMTAKLPSSVSTSAMKEQQDAEGQADNCIYRVR